MRYPTPYHEGLEARRRLAELRARKAARAGQAVADTAPPQLGSALLTVSVIGALAAAMACAIVLL